MGGGPFAVAVDELMGAAKSLRWRRVIAVSLTIALIVGGLLLAPLVREAHIARRERLAALPQPRPATDELQVQIVRALLAQHRFQGVPMAPPEPGESPRADPRRYPMLHDRTLAMRRCLIAPTQANPLPCGPPPPGELDATFLWSDDIYWRDLPLRSRRELVLANATSTPLPDPGIDGVQLLAARPSAGGWRGFHRSHPQATGWLVLSRATLSADGREALIYVDHGCDDLCGTSAVFRFVRGPNGWRLVKTYVYGMR
jgi:hypothetical protein